MTPLSYLLPRVKELASEAPPPKDVCWIVLGDEEYHANYCPECARKIVAWLSEGGEQPQFDEDDEHPTWSPLDSDEVYFSRTTLYESDGCEHCELCGHHLAVSLTFYGVQSELDHFETHGIDTPDDWAHVLDIFEAVQYAETWTDSEMRPFYDRVSVLVENRLRELKEAAR